MKTQVNKETCIGCEVCVGVCPDIFEMEGSVAVVKAVAIPEALQAAVRDAAESCPVAAITVEEA